MARWVGFVLRHEFIFSLALIHRHRPDLVDFDSLKQNNKHENMKLAFDIAEQHIGIPVFFLP